MRTAPVDRTEPLAVAAPLREIFMKSIVASRDLPAGTLLRREDLALKKPGTGLPAARLGDIVGRRLARPLARDALLAPTDRSEAHTSELQSLMRISYAVFCLQKKKTILIAYSHYITLLN